MKECKTCGYLNNENLTFCNNCGAPLFIHEEKEKTEKFSDIDYKGMYGAEYLNRNKKKNIFLALLFISLIGIFVGAFLPYTKVINNYFYIADKKEILFGGYIAAVSFISLVLIGLHKKIPVLILQLAGLSLAIYDYIKKGYNLKDYQYGFYIFAISLVFSVIFSLTRLMSKKFK